MRYPQVLTELRQKSVMAQLDSRVRVSIAVQCARVVHPLYLRANWGSTEGSQKLEDVLKLAEQFAAGADVPETAIQEAKKIAETESQRSYKSANDEVQYTARYANTASTAVAQAVAHTVEAILSPDAAQAVLDDAAEAISEAQSEAINESEARELIQKIEAILEPYVPSNPTAQE